MPWIYNYAELGPQQIEDLLGFAPFCSLAASSPNSKITFKGKSRKWASPVASLERCKGSWTYGSVHLIPIDEVSIFDKYHQNYIKIEVPLLIEATKDKIKAITYVMDKDAPPGPPSDDYAKAVLKHLKFFWNQGGDTNLSLENFGITVQSPDIKKKNEKITAEVVKNVISDLENIPVKSKKRAKHE